MERKAWCVLVYLLTVVMVVGACQVTPPSPTSEERDWEEANKAYTVASFEHYLAMHPAGSHGAQAQANIVALQTVEKQRPRMLKGTVKKKEASSRTLTVKTPMGKTEVFRITDATRIEKQGTKQTLRDLTTGSGMKIEYTNLPDGALLAGKISIGYSVSHCSCGAGCRCSLSRGCRTIRY